MATRFYRPLKVTAFNANDILWQRYDLSKQLQDHGAREISSGYIRPETLLSKKSRKDERRKIKRWIGPEYENGIRDRGLKQQLHGNKQTKNPTMNDIEGWSPGERAPREAEEHARRT
jgi:hypothetical protein